MNTSKQINIIVALIFASLIATGAYWMWDPDRADDAEARQLETTIERGAFLFSQNCRICHGDSGEGGAAANRLRAAPALNRPDLQGVDATSGAVSAQLKKQQYRLVFNTITCGRVGTAMPTWGQTQGGTLSDEQLRQLAVFITEGTGWEHAKEFAIEGFPDGEVHGDAEVPFTLAEPIAASDTDVVLSDASTLVAGERLQFDNELMLIQAVGADKTTVTVERGLGSTSPADHALDAEILKPPVPLEPVATVQAACGQSAKAGGGATATPEPSTAELTIESAAGNVYNKTELYALPGVPLTLTHTNTDNGVSHNWELYASQDAALNGDTPIVTSDIEAGPASQVINFGPLDAGEYYFQCLVHPGTMFGILYAQESPAADGAAAAETPAPADGAATDGAAADATAAP